MPVAQQYVARQSGGRGGPSGLADVLDVLLDKGLVIDAFVRVSLVGIELLTIDARVVIAGVDTYLHFAEAVNRLDLLQASSAQPLPELLGSGKPKQRDNNQRSNNNEEPQRGELQQPDSQSDGRDEHGDDNDRQKDGASDNKGLLSRLVDRGQAF
jgi:hypothetical protein